MEKIFLFSCLKDENKENEAGIVPFFKTLEYAACFSPFSAFSSLSFKMFPELKLTCHFFIRFQSGLLLRACFDTTPLSWCHDKASWWQIGELLFFNGISNSWLMSRETSAWRADWYVTSDKRRSTRGTLRASSSSIVSLENKNSFDEQILAWNWLFFRSTEVIHFYYFWIFYWFNWVEIWAKICCLVANSLSFKYVIKF